MRSDASFFVIFLVTTVAVLTWVVLSGRAAYRRVHLLAVLCLLVSLGAAIFFAERLGTHFDLESAGWITPLHLGLAKLTTLGYLAPIATGIHTWRHPGTRRTHGRIAYTLVALTLATALTGIWMILSAERHLES